MSDVTESTILYVDDDNDHCILTETSIADAGNKVNRIWANDKEGAVNHLNLISDSTLPLLTELDLNIPRWDDRRTLSCLKSHPHPAYIPVITLSTFKSSNGHEACEWLGAVSHIKKPYHYDDYKGILTDFFLHIKA